MIDEEIPIVSTAPVITIPPIAETPLVPPSARKSYGWLIGLIVALVVAAALGAGGWFLYRTLIPTPSEVLAKMMETAIGVKTAHVELTLVPIKGSDPISQKLLSSLSADAVLPDVANVIVTTAGDIELVDFFTNDIRYSMSSCVAADDKDGIQQVLVAGDMIQEGDTSYWRLSTFAFPQKNEGVMEQALTSVIFNEILNKWVGGADDVTATLQAKIKEAQQKKIAEAPLTDAHFQALKEAWTTSSVLSVSQVYAEEVVAGEKAYHYGLTFDPQAWGIFLDRLEAIVADTYLGSDDQSWTKPLRSFALQNTEVWISPSRFLPLRIKTSLVDTTKDTQMDADLSLSAYGDPVEITLPTDAISSMDLIELMFTKMEDFMNEDPDADGLTNQEELRYKTDMNNPDSDGDGYLDGEEVKGGYDPNSLGKLD